MPTMADTVGVVPPSAPPPQPHFKHPNQTLNAVSFGFIATAVLFAMFLVMAIFERILRPHRAARAAARDEERAESIPESSTDSQKPELCHSNSYSQAVSVLMPGQDYPTYFARPVPSPCAPECLVWPSHDVSSEIDFCEKENLHDLEKGRGEASASAASHTGVFQDVGKEKGESSSPASPEKEYMQDVVKAQVESSSSASCGKEVLQNSNRH